MKILALSLLLVATAMNAEELKFVPVPGFFEKLPDRELGPCHGGAVIDRQGQVYVSTDTPRGIDVFSAEGKYLRSFAPTLVHAMELREEDGTEYIYAALPTKHEVVKLKLDGERVWTLNYPAESGLYKDANGFNPCAVTVAPDGSIFVADGYGSNHVLKFDRDRKFVKAFGGPGKEEGKFNVCHGIGLDLRQDKPLLFVCNRNNDRVEYWDLDGNFVSVIQKDMRMPASVHIRDGLALVPELKGRATLLQKDGTVAARIGDNPNPAQQANFGLPKDQWTEGVCNSPHGGSIDQHGDVVITEWSKFGRLHKFRREQAGQ